ncbi:MAG: DUF1800 domain-containing protein [Pseudomonadota bacterium]
MDHRTIASVRFGFGLTPLETGPQDAADLMDQLRRPENATLIVPTQSYATRLAQFSKERRQRKKQLAGLSDKAAKDLKKKFQKERQSVTRKLLGEDTRSLLVQRSEGSGFFERLTAFWADNFAIGRRGGLIAGAADLPTYETEIVRPHVMGDFSDMLHAVVNSPNMLKYLDQGRSTGPNSAVGRRSKDDVNENLAREVLELHTLGVSGPYTQDDVRQLALLLTGYSFDRRTGEYEFNTQIAEPGMKSILGKSYGGPRPEPRHVLRFLDDLALHPVTAEHLAWKLAVHFVSPKPSPSLVAHLKSAYLESKGHLPKVYQALLEHPDAWSPELQKVKQPIEFVIALFRASNRSFQDLNNKQTGLLGKWLKQNNQHLWQPNGPDGWPEEAGYWINSAAIVSRFELSGRLAQDLSNMSKYDPRRLAEQVLGASLQPTTAFAVGAAETRADGFAMIFSSPEFNRR